MPFRSHPLTNMSTMKSRKYLRTQEILQNASDMLGVASNLAPLIPVPVLCSIFVSAKKIVDMSIKMRQDKRDSAELAGYVASLTSNVHKTIRGKENMINKDLSLSLNQLSIALEDTKEFMERQVALRFWERLCTRSEVAETLAEHRTRLEYVMQTFITTSNLRQEMSLKYLTDGMDILKETLESGRTFDGQFRIYRWGDLEVIRPHDLPSENFLSEIEIYDANIEGNLKVVKVYRNQNAFLRSRNVLRLVRECPRLPFAQLEGYTGDSTSPFLVLKGGLTNMFEYLMQLELTDYFVERLGFMIDIKRAVAFLASHGFRWKGWVEKLMVNGSGRLAMGYADDIMQRQDSDSDRGNSHIMISWPKLEVAEGLHVLVEREDEVLKPLHSALQMPTNRYDLNTVAHLWGQYIDELSCGITSFISITNSYPPPLGSVGFLRFEDDGMRFDGLLSSYAGKVNVRTTGQIRPRKNLQKDVRSTFDGRFGNNFAGEEISMPLRVDQETGSLLVFRTSYTQLQGQSRIVEHLVRAGHQLSHSADIDIGSLVIVSAIIERASAEFSDDSSEVDSAGSTFFHPHPPDERGFMQKPWGFMSRTADHTADAGWNDDNECTQYTHDYTNAFRLGPGVVGRTIACTK